MKNLKFIFIGLCLALLNISINAQIKIEANRNITLWGEHWTGGIKIVDYSTGGQNFVGIYPNTDWRGGLGISTNRFAFAHIYSVNYGQLIQTPCDLSAKENIINIDNAITKLCKLRSVKYDIKKEYYAKNKAKSLDKKKDAEIENERKNVYGFIAQEMKEVYPDLVKTDSATGIHGINIVGLIPVLVEAVKEQSQIVDAQSLKIKELDSRISKLEELLANKKSNLKSAKVNDVFTTSDNTTDAFLYQNAPNPFNQTTEIAYFLPDGIQKASLNIYDMNGKQLKIISITQLGKGSITVNGTELHPGMYFYSLIADGKEIDTKRMILTE